MGVYTEEELRSFGELGPKVLGGLAKKDEPFDVPMADENEDEFAMLKNAERKSLIGLGEYDLLRIILEEERLAEEEAQRELVEEDAAERAEEEEVA